MKAGGSLVCRVYETVELKIVKEESKVNIRITTPSLRRARFYLFGQGIQTHYLYMYKLIYETRIFREWKL